MTRTRILVLALMLLAFALLACVDPTPNPAPVPCDELEGTARFTPDAIERCGCPDEDKVPTWMEIPECPS